MNKSVLATLALAAATLLVASCLSSSKEVMESKPVRTLSYTASEMDLANCIVQRAIETPLTDGGIPVATQLRDTVRITRVEKRIPPYSDAVVWVLTLNQGTADLQLDASRPALWEGEALQLFEPCEREFGTVG